MREEKARTIWKKVAFAIALTLMVYAVHSRKERNSYPVLVINAQYNVNAISLAFSQDEKLWLVGH